MINKPLLLFFVLIIYDQIVLAQKETENVKPIRVEVERVVIPITVTDETGGVVTNLEKNNFEVSEDKNAQTITSLEGTDSEISVGIILDVSGSMQYKWLEAARALMEFMKTANPKDEFLLITFADRPYFNLGFTQIELELQKKLMILRPEGNTALLDAIYLGIHEVKKGRYPRRALLIISDGGDNHSRYGQKEIEDLVKESDVLIYAIGIYNRDPKEFKNSNPLTADIETKTEMLEILRGEFLLGEVTKVSGGKLFKFVITQLFQNNSSLSDITRKISLELRNQYLLTYRSTNEERDGRWRKLKVKLVGIPNSQDFIVRHKEGYYASQ